MSWYFLLFLFRSLRNTSYYAWNRTGTYIINHLIILNQFYYLDFYLWLFRNLFGQLFNNCFFDYFFNYCFLGGLFLFFPNPILFYLNFLFFNFDLNCLCKKNRHFIFFRYNRFDVKSSSSSFSQLTQLNHCRFTCLFFIKYFFFNFLIFISLCINRDWRYYLNNWLGCYCFWFWLCYFLNNYLIRLNCLVFQFFLWFIFLFYRCLLNFI